MVKAKKIFTGLQMFLIVVLTILVSEVFWLSLDKYQDKDYFEEHNCYETPKEESNQNFHFLNVSHCDKNSSINCWVYDDEVYYGRSHTRSDFNSDKTLILIYE